MGDWIRARWRAYLDSTDPVALLAGSAPGPTLIAVPTLSTIFFVLAYAPGIRDVADFRYPWVAAAFAIIAGSLTITAWKHRCRGPIGSVATLLDNTFYSLAFGFASMNTRDSVAIAMALIHAVVLVVFPGQVYALTLLLALTMTVPSAVMLVLFKPALPVVMITVSGVALMLIASSMTGKRREFARKQKTLEEALDAAARVADESVQAALTSTLLTLGHFLHELSNYQTAISTNLDYIKVKARLGPEVSRALNDAQTAQQEQENLLRRTISDLRSRARPEQGTFHLISVLRSVAADAHGVNALVSAPESDFEMTGNPEHLRVVLLNLLRNAEQADARTVKLDVSADAAGHAAVLVVHNDGAPLPEGAVQKLFESFATSAKPGGSGLGLYLVRRYVELLGGRITAGASPMGGASFTMRLPIRARRDTTGTRSVSAIRNIQEKSA